jgi:hypothetical protein
MGLVLNPLTRTLHPVSILLDKEFDKKLNE